MTVFTEMYISLATSAVLSMPGHVAEHLALTFAERYDHHRRRLRRPALAGRRHAEADQAGLEQLPVRAGQFRVTPQHAAEPAALHGERQPELLSLGQPQRGLK